MASGVGGPSAGEHFRKDRIYFWPPYQSLVLSGVVATFLAGVSWTLALTKFQLSYAYPFTSLAYVAVMASGVLLFKDDVSAGRMIGTAVVMLGVLIIANFGQRKCFIRHSLGK